MVKWHHFEEEEKAKIILIESRSSDFLALENLIYNMLVCTRREEISKLPLLGIAILSLCCSFPLTLKCCLGEITILDENSKAGLKRKKKSFSKQASIQPENANKSYEKKSSAFYTFEVTFAICCSQLMTLQST